jgi:glycosyltransferase involved in cell wall biosynthesis
MKLSILMPVYNEIGTIAEIVKLVAAALPDVEKELVLVDDGSRDGTRDWLIGSFGQVTKEYELIAGGPESVATAKFCNKLAVRIVFHDNNKGKGAAIRTAMKVCSGDVIVIQDADLEYDPSDWVSMYELIAVRSVADVVYGSRFYGKPHRSLYYHHYVANRFISIFFNVLYNQMLTDIEVCYKMFTRSVLETLNVTSNHFGIEVQISAQIALNRNWRIYEMGIRYYGRTYREGKKINWKDGVKALWYLVQFRIWPGNESKTRSKFPVGV